MFEKLVVSSVQRRRTRAAKFFLGTSLIYLSVTAGAIALSVVFASPKLADTRGEAPKPPILFPIAATREPSQCGTPGQVAVTDHRVVKPLEKIIEDLGNRQDLPIERHLPPGTKLVGADAAVDGFPGIGSPGPGLGTPGQAAITEPARPPDPPQPQPRPADKVKPLLIPSTVLQGKAIEAS
jgi:hypothetical protein